MGKTNHMKNTTLHITKPLIDNATRKDSHHCMISDAVREKYPDAKYIHSDLQSVRFSVNGKRYCYFTPPEAQVALLQFDQGQPVKPFKTVLTRGTESKCGLAATHPNFVRKKYKVRNRKVRIYPKREREFGLRKLVK